MASPPASSDAGALPDLMNPGEMALTVMPLDASSLASERVSTRMTALANSKPNFIFRYFCSSHSW
jgi:hypothetical protein